MDTCHNPSDTRLNPGPLNNRVINSTNLNNWVFDSTNPNASMESLIPPIKQINGVFDSIIMK